MKRKRGDVWIDKYGRWHGSKKNLALFDSLLMGFFADPKGSELGRTIMEVAAEHGLKPKTDE